MAYQIREADTVLSPSPPLGPDTLQGERDRLEAIRRRLEAAAEALARVRDQLQARAPGYRGWDEDREHSGAAAGHFNPKGGRP
jgi:hypothetical protein